MDIITKPPEIPPTTDRRYNMLKRYHALDKDGLARVGEKLDDGDIYINKCVPEAASLNQIETQ
jgi:DNA-directed RNA polymerase beta subunit